jgi:hypothetical protein
MEVGIPDDDNILSFGKDEYFQLLEPHEAQKK